MTIKGITARRDPPQVLRFGVAMPAMKAQIVDLIAAAGANGIETAELVRSLYNGGPLRNPKTIANLVTGINNLFQECDVRVRCERGRYRIVREDVA